MKSKIITLFAITSLLLLIHAGNATDTIRTISSEKIPAELTGKWLNGTFSMSNWWSYDGKKYIGNPYSRSVAFNFLATGETEFFLVIKTHTGYCSTEAFTYHKGNVIFPVLDRKSVV